MKRKVAILGGGCGSMAAAWALTQLPNWQDKFDITVYQMGWRLGGKGASGRDESSAYRILEHGLHVWGGFYENAFRAMQEVYGALPADTGNPLEAWDDAFKKLSDVILQEEVRGEWLNWYLTFPENNAVPGTGGVIPSIWDYIALFLNWLESRITEHTEAIAVSPLTEQVRAAAVDSAHAPHVSFFERLFPVHFADGRRPDVRLPLEGLHPVDLIRAARAVHSAVSSDPTQRAATHAVDILTIVEAAVDAFEARVQGIGDDIRRLLMIINYGVATLRGIIRGGVLTGGWAAINNYEWTDWLRRNGARESTYNGPIVRGIYDYVFGFVKGDIKTRGLEAGTATNGVLRLFFTYKGGIFWEMQAGMGDVVFGPFYRVLHNRGVKFEFFHKVLGVRVPSGGTTVEAIDLSVQATTKNGGEYDPLLRVGGVHAWPAHPLYDQLVQGDELRDNKIDLESFWADWPGTPKTLTRGVDFDDVVLGISLGAFQYIAQEVSAASPAFAAMVGNVRTVQTAAMQVWLDEKGVDIGASNVLRASTAGIEPLSTWSDMSFLLQREQWPPDGPPPQFIAYFCGVFQDADNFPPPPDPAFPPEQLERWKQIAIEWLTNNTGVIWPKGTLPNGKTLNWALLHDPNGGSGTARLNAQFFKVNIDPSERYVMSVPNSSMYRLDAGQSGIKNLWLAGDWVRTSINAGCVEAAVIAGLACAAALSGEPVDIIGS